MDTNHLAQQVTAIIDQLHGHFEQIGVSRAERESRESELFTALSRTLDDQLKKVEAEKQELTEQARQLIHAIRQMENSLEDSKHRGASDRHDNLRVTYPILDCIEDLKQKHKVVNKLFLERFEQIKKLAEAFQSYASHLEPTFSSIKLPPLQKNARLSPSFDISPSYVSRLDTEFTRVYDEYNKRLAVVSALGDEIVTLWTELGTAQVQIDSAIVRNYRDAPEQLGLHSCDISRLESKRDKLADEKHARERQLKDIKSTIEILWNKLGQDEAERREFLAANRGCGLRTINVFQEELSRLEALKRQKIHLFVEDARIQLQRLWDELYFSEEEMLGFGAAFSDVYSDALLSAHEAEISRLEALKEQRAPILALVDKHQSLLKDRADLEASSQDASRLLAKGTKGGRNDPGRLLREEKMRKRIARDLPKIEVELSRVCETFEEQYGKPFLVHGQRYLDEIERSAAAPKTSGSRPKTPANNLIPNTTTRTVPIAPPASVSRSRNVTRSDVPSSRSKTPVGRSNLPANSTKNPPSGHKAPSSLFSQSTRTPTASHAASRTPNFSQSTRTSPTKLPARAPLSNMPNGNNSPQRRAPAAAPSGRMQKMTASANGSPPKSKGLYGRAPPTPSTVVSHNDNSDLSTGSVRNVTPEDVYHDRTRISQPSWSTSASQISRPGSVLHHYQTSRQPPSNGGYPSAPPVIRQLSNASFLESGSKMSASENWETFGNASDTDDAESRASYKQSMMRTIKRLTPEDGHDGLGLDDNNKRVKGPGHGLGISNGCANTIKMAGREGTVDGSENAWTDESVF